LSLVRADNVELPRPAACIDPRCPTFAVAE